MSIKGIRTLDILYGTASEDKLFGGDAADTAYGYGGDDLIQGNGGDDTLYGGSGSDSIDGGSGNDVIWGEGAPDKSFAPLHFDDLIFGGDGNDTVYGEQGDDQIVGGLGVDSLFGGDGKDSLEGEYVHGGNGDDSLTGLSGLYGGDGNDYLQFGVGLTVGSALFGGAGDDVMALGSASRQAVLVWGGEGNDTIVGGPPSTFVGSGPTVHGEGGVDFISIFGGFADGGNDKDILEMRAGTLPGSISGGSGADLVRSTQYNQIVTGEGHDSVELLNGFANGTNLEGGGWLDFNAAEDHIGVVGYGFDSFAEFVAAANVSIVQSGNNVVIGIEGQASLTLYNVNIGSLTEDNFYFG